MRQLVFVQDAQMPSASSLPDFLILGAPKAGTTSLYAYLSQHPEVFMPSLKEPRFLSYDPHRPPYGGPYGQSMTKPIPTLAEYQRLFRGRQPEHRAAGEASPVYIGSPVAVSAIQKLIPDARLVAILRQPADRAFSSYTFLKSQNREDAESFEAALDAWPAREAANWPGFYDYVGRSRYAAQLCRYLAAFPREQLLVLLFEDLVRDPTDVLARTCIHIGVDPTFAFDVRQRHNPTYGPPRPVVGNTVASMLLSRGSLKQFGRRVLPIPVRERLWATVARWNAGTRESFDPDLRAHLTASLTDDIERLESLLGLDLGIWKAGPTAG